ncbi:hypothetical protein E1B28_009094 [Marasmius oreades]|uniref:Cytosine-specific methyltransferase n=1 Tax=Marasmius oreades TaxID=181124 RepID=A0A9P7RZR3_9AGAR|nr:uncharacterized protein E1B28_009094 [Marasmius oreades]KAG7092771.1 hypothetical protein E1B28_009094 [Marasmius oreades]
MVRESQVRPFVEITTPKWLYTVPHRLKRDRKSTVTTRVGSSSTTPVHPDQPKSKRTKRTVQVADYVEIHVPQKRVENASTNPSERKRRRKLDTSTTHHRQESPTASETQLRLCQSPTASDLANHHVPPSRSVSPEFPNHYLPLGDSRPEILYTPLVEVSTDSDADMPEDEDLVIPGEDNRGISFEDDDDDEIVPVRVLNEFTIYHRHTKDLVSLSSLNGMDFETEFLGATGIVKPWVEHEEEKEEEEEEEELYNSEEDNDFPSVTLSQILEFDIHHYSLDEEGRGSFDGKIYIRTNYAWYILDRPSPMYMPFFKSFFIQHRLCHLILSRLLLDIELSTEEFTSSLERIQGQHDTGLVPSVLCILGRKLNGQDLQRDAVKAYLSVTIPQVSFLHGLHEFEKAEIVATTTCSKWSQSRHKPSSDRPRQSRSTSNMELQVLKHQNDTVVTPVVERIVRDLYDLTLEVAGTSTMGEEGEAEDEALAKEIQNVIEHHEDPQRIKWGQQIMNCENYYESVYLDGEVYTIGDDVMVSVGEDQIGSSIGYEDPEMSDEGQDLRKEDSVVGVTGKGNYYANHVWFCKISYFFEDYMDIDPRTRKPIKKFHGQWFNHGHKTYLQETAHSRSLFLLPKCDDNHVATIFRRCKIKFLAPGENEDVDDKAHMGAEFHCALMLDEVQCAFVNIPSDDTMQRLCESQPDHKKCLGCALQCEVEDETKIKEVSGGGFSRYGVEYHVQDFVYVMNGDDTNLLEVVQILDMKRKGHENVSVSVKCFSRRDDIVEREEGQPVEEKRLVGTRSKKQIDFDEVDGKCFVRHLSKPKSIEKWIQSDDHWFFNEEQNADGRIVPISAERIQVCEYCLVSREEDIDQFKETLKRRGKLRGLELFSGGGGLGTGMNFSGIVDTQWAVEFSPSSARTYQANHPQTKVYCQDVNLLLKHVIETREGKCPKPLQSNLSVKEYCPEMPKKGQVDFIFGGPPCQAFSGANHSPKANDIRSSLPCNMLSYVEEFEPDYFLLENVTGLLRFPLKSKNDGNRLVGGIKMGVVKMIVRVLIALGYQVRFKILEAGQYGAPQSRKRVIFWGAKRGLKLPDFPAPTHAFPKSAWMWKLPCETGRSLPPATRSRDPDVIENGKYTYAPLKNVTVFDAINDLPPFDWINPHATMAATQADTAEVQARFEQGIMQCEAVRSGHSGQWDDLPGFPNGVKYATQPLNAYQKWMREKVGKGEDVKGHVTTRYLSSIVERLVDKYIG